MAIVSKPPWLSNLLASGWLNINKGEWLDVWGFPKLPPIDFNPGSAIEQGIDILLWPINTTHDLANSVYTQVWQVAKDAANAVYKIDSWILGAVSWFTDQVTGWWGTIWDPIYAALLTIIGTASDLASSAWDWIDNAGTWIKGHTDPIYTWIGTILENYIPWGIFKDLWKDVEGFLEWWWDRGEDVIDFFNDPWDFLYKKFDDFFERFW